MLIALVWCWEMVPLSLWASQTPRGPQRWVWLGGKGCHGKGHCCALRAGLRCREPGAGAARDFLRSFHAWPYAPVFFGETMLGLGSPGHEGPHQGFHIKGRHLKKGQVQRPQIQDRFCGKVIWVIHNGGIFV